MAKVSLIWVDAPGLEGLDPAAIAKGAGIELDKGGSPETAVVTCLKERAAIGLTQRLAGLPVKWLDLAAEVGGGSGALRLARAISSVARAAGSASLGTMAQIYTPQPNQEVLVAGRGMAAVAAAKETAALGHPVLLALTGTKGRAACRDESTGAVKAMLAELPAQVEVAIKTEATGIEGGGGDFTVWLNDAKKTFPRKFGAVVLAPPSQYAADYGADKFAPEITATISELKTSKIKGGDDGWFHAAVMAGLGENSTAHGFERAVAAALALQKRPKVQVTMFIREARVATEGGERLYREARLAGVLVARVGDGGPVIEDGGRLISFHDPVLGEDLQLKPDLVVLGEEVSAPTPAWLDNPLAVTAWDQDLPDHARLQAGRTAKSGLYLIGGATDAAPGQARLEQAAATAADLHYMLNGGAEAIPAVHDVLCASCLTCVRVCPHGVVRYQGDHIQPAPAACLACGICAAECPAEAIAPPGWSNREMFAGLERGLAAAGDDKLVLFGCRNSCMDAARELSLSGHQWPAGLVMAPVNCAGRVGIQLILKALTLGARGVLVAGCHDGNCRSLNGNLRAKLRASEASALMEEVGAGAEMVRFMHMASNQPQALAAAVAEMAETAGES